MPGRRGVFLTGATGLLGQYLLQDLLCRGYPVAVLVRDSRKVQAAERIAEVVDFWSERHGRSLPAPIVLSGDLSQVDLGLSSTDRHWLGRHCQSVIHSAANLSFRKTADGEPWRTNVDGTKSLLDLCRTTGLAEWHQISTAFVCGRRTDVVDEDDIDHSPSFHNPYEESKYQAEKLIRGTAGIHSTFYRPSVIIGDSRTGYTSTYTGLYRFLELAVQLASANSGLDDCSQPLRLPLNGDEPWNLVPVDWVSRVIVELLAKSQWHGRTFHLVTRSPVSTRLIRDVAVKELNLLSVEFAGSEGVAKLNRREQLFNSGIREYWPYLSGNPSFSSLNTREACPDLPPPSVDQEMLERLMRFAVAHHWGRRGASARSTAERPQPTAQSFCAEYIEKTFPGQSNRSRMAREARLDLTISFDLRGPGGGEWSCQWIQGELVSVKKGLAVDAAVTYHTDTATFESIVKGIQSPQEAFFEQQIEITGDMESALKLTVLFGQFLTEELVPQSELTEVIDAASTPA